MKYITSILLIFSMYLSSFSQNDHDTIIDSISYNYISYFKNGNIKELGSYQNVKQKKVRQGEWVVYDRDSTIKEKGKYKNGLKVGFWNEGSWRGHYNNGKKEGNGLMVVLCLYIIKTAMSIKENMFVGYK